MGVRRALVVLGIVAAVSSSLTACVERATSQSDRNATLPERASVSSVANSSPEERVKVGANAFALRLFKELDADADGNTVCSPFSATTALAMTYNGASGRTAEEIASVLGVEGMPLRSVNKILAETVSSIEITPTAMELATPDAAVTEIDVANSIWAAKDLRLRKTFTAALGEHYGAGVHQVDLGDPVARRRIDEWMTKQSRGLLHLDAQPTGPLVLINTMYFRSTWLHRFRSRETTQAPFALPHGRRVPVPMMRLEAKAEPDLLRYAETADVQAIRLPYTHEDLAMYVLLPKPGRDLSEVVRSLDEASWRELATSMKERPGVLQMPRFDIRRERSLKTPLQRMGMRRAFGSTADLNRAVEGRSVPIDDVIHEVRIKVDETGTAAAAESMLTFLGADAQEDPNKPYKMLVDHPFAFLIVDEDTGSILFTGAVRDPR